MGKNQEIKSLANSIALVSVHKILLKYTNKPESRGHLEDEKRNYSEDAFDKSRVHTWTKEELEVIKTKAIIETKNRLNKYPDIILDDFECGEFVVDTMQGLLLLK